MNSPTPSSWPRNDDCARLAKQAMSDQPRARPAAQNTITTRPPFAADADAAAARLRWNLMRHAARFTRHVECVRA